MSALSPHGADPKVRVGLWVVPAFVALLALALWAQPGQSMPYTVGEVLAKVLLPAVLVALVASRVSSWRGWWTGAAVVVPALVLIVLTDVVPGRAAAAAAEAERADLARHLAIPENVGHWKRVTGDDVIARADQVRSSVARVPGSSAFVYGEYRDHGAGFTVMGFTSLDGPDLSDGRTERERAVIDDFMNGMTSRDADWLDAGPLGGSMSCATGTGNGDAVHCAWADAATMGTVIFDRATSVAEAGRTTRGIRAAVTVID